MSSNVAATSTSNQELNSTVDECNELASCSVFKQSNEMKEFFIIFLTHSDGFTQRWVRYKKSKGKRPLFNVPR